MKEIFVEFVDGTSRVLGSPQGSIDYFARQTALNGIVEYEEGGDLVITPVYQIRRVRVRTTVETAVTT